MDYSSMPDNPDEPSPWGSPGASPRQARDPAFTSLADDPSQTPFGYESNNENDTAAVPRADADDLGGDGFRDPDTAKSRTDDVFREQKAKPDETRDLPPSQTSAQQPPAQQPPPEPPQKSQEQVRAMEHGQTAEAPSARPAAPQPRLQAKITGLERTGKKDPILRFDVHVCLQRPEAPVIAPHC